MYSKCTDCRIKLDIRLSPTFFVNVFIQCGHMCFFSQSDVVHIKRILTGHIYPSNI